MHTSLTLAAACLTLGLGACSKPSEMRPSTIAAPLTGERLAYVVGCVNCHHQTPKDILNAPPLTVVKMYSVAEFTTLLNTGVTRSGRDMYAQGSIMGIVAREQLSHLSRDEMNAIYTFLRTQWSDERAAYEEAKIATFPPPTFMQQ